MILKRTLKLYGTCLLANIMCFVLVMTLIMIGTNLCGKQIGYSMQGTKKGTEDRTILYSYNYSDGKDTQKQKYIDEGYELTEIPINSTTVTYDVISQIFLFCLMGIFVYNNLWNAGYKDINFVKHGEINENKLRGLLVGFLATLPSIIMLTVFVVGRKTFAKTVSVAVFSLLNPYLHRAIYLLSGSQGAYISEISAGNLGILYLFLLFIPIVACVSYILGYKSVIVSEKLLFKKNQEK